MARFLKSSPAVCAKSALFALSTFVFGAAANASQTTVATLTNAQQKLAAMSVPFVPNAGQWDARAAFAAQTFAGTLFVTKQGELVYSLPGKPLPGSNVGADLAALGDRATPSPRLQKSSERSPGWALSETLVDTNGQARSMTQSTLKAPAGYRPMEGKVSYAIGADTTKHAENLNTYERVNLGDMYPGVNVQLRATGSNVEKIFTVAPQHHPGQIRVKLDGAEKLEIGAQGELIAHTGNGPVTFTKPIAFQEIDGVRRDVEVQYALNAASREYGFSLGTFDSAKPLTIDPLLQSTYLGGAANDRANALAIHPATGEVYVAGYTDAVNFPGTATPTAGAQASTGGGRDAFVTRFNATLTTRLQSTYLGGSGSDIAGALAIHPATGEVYVVGETDSSNFPGAATPTTGAQATLGGGTDAFVARFNAALTTRLQSTYLGGSSFDSAQAVAIHPATGEVYVVGYTNSTSFPGAATPTAGAQTTMGGGSDAFVTRFNATLTTLLQSTYLGGNASDTANAVALHPATGEVIVAGYTESTNFPGAATPSAGAQTSLGGGSDGFVTRLNTALTSRLQSTYVGGAGNDSANGIAIHPATGEVVVAGYTESTNFPGTATPTAGAQTGSGGGRDGFVTRFNATLTSRLQSTYLGGSAVDDVRAVAIDPATGEIYVAGYTGSTNFPGTTSPTAGAQIGSGGDSDAFITRFNAALTARLRSTYLGGSGGDGAFALAIHPATREIYVAGDTDFTDFPGTASPTAGAQTTSGGGRDAIVSRLSPDLADVNRIPNPFSFIHQSNVTPNTIRTSNEVQLVITPTPPNNQQTAYVTGTVGSELCIATDPGVCVTPYVGCSSPCYSTGWFAGPWDFLSGDYITVRHISANPGGTAETTLIISGTAYPFRSSTGNANIACNLDMNGDNVLSAPLEGLILVRAMLGFGADAIVAGTGIPAWNPVRERLNTFCGTNFPYSPSAFQ